MTQTRKNRGENADILELIQFVQVLQAVFRSLMGYILLHIYRWRGDTEVTDGDFDQSVNIVMTQFTIMALMTHADQQTTGNRAGLDKSGFPLLSCSHTIVIINHLHLRMSFRVSARVHVK